MIRAALIACAVMAATETDAACRQALSLGLDVSGSVDAQEYALQRQGLADALDSPDVRAVLFAEGLAPVRLSVFEWSGPRDQAVIVGWTELSGPADLADVIAALGRIGPRAQLPHTTAIGSAMLFGAALLEEHPDCWKRTLDLSGDGEANTGPPPGEVSLPPGLGDITVNGLVIGAGDRLGGDHRAANIRRLGSYYGLHVIRGADAFVESALGFEDFGEAMERKLLRELQVVAIGQLRQ